ncbi:hypothetical protein GCM10010393_20490 [Streptomyces gobitricini]|uniref:ATP-grasp domain-containing protein n=1 Tax=Streptomyces gobitricini TaxID=68211 RepID=A0ABP5Z0V5_9ACTN
MLPRHLRGAGLWRASQVAVDPFAPDAAGVSGTLSYPAVLKDVSGTGSEGVVDRVRPRRRARHPRRRPQPPPAAAASRAAP